MITKMSSCPQVLCIRGCWHGYIRSRIIWTRWLPKCHHTQRCCEYGGCSKQVHPVEESQDITMTVDGLNWVRFVTPTRRRWASNNYITRVKTGSQSVGDKMRKREPAPSRSPIEQLQLERRCWNEDHVPVEAGPPDPQLSSPGEWERDDIMAIRVGVNMLQFCSASNSLSHSKAFSNPFEPFQIKWEVYFSKELCLLSLLCRRYDSECICIWVCNNWRIHFHSSVDTSVRRDQCQWSSRGRHIIVTATVKHPVKHTHTMLHTIQYVTFCNTKYKLGVQIFVNMVSIVAFIVNIILLKGI